MGRPKALQNPQRLSGVGLVPSPTKTTWVKVAVDQTTLPMQQMEIEALSIFATKAHKEPLGVTTYSLAAATQYTVLRAVDFSPLTNRKVAIDEQIKE
jgi:hypothetical protein